jgi:aldose 1-epimerase
VHGSELNLRYERRLGDWRIDHSFVLRDPSWAATLHDPRSGRQMRVITDQSGLQVYTGELLPTPRSGICLQTGAWPDAPNHPDFPSARCDPGEVYRHRTTHMFGAG